MDQAPDYTAVIAQVSRQLKRLTREQMNTRVGSSTPTIAGIVLRMTKNGKESLETALDGPLNSEMSYHLGQLVIILDILAMRNERSMFIRWFD
jgi:hypothetical protein